VLKHLPAYGDPALRLLDLVFLFLNSGKHAAVLGHELLDQHGVLPRSGGPFIVAIVVQLRLGFVQPNLAWVLRRYRSSYSRALARFWVR
jgi:hypothetical protein